MSSSALDRQVHVTVFTDVHAKNRTSHAISLREFAPALLNTRAESKNRLQLFAPSSFDSKRTSKGSLRSDGNVRETFAVVGDYDKEETSFDEACARLRAAGLTAVIVTTPSHTPDKPRWRVVALLSDPLHRNRANATGCQLSDYGRLVSRLAGVLAVDLDPQSWSLSQSYFVGTIDTAPDHRLEMIDGTACIDQRADLDATARPKPGRPKPARPSRKAPRAADVSNGPSTPGDAEIPNSLDTHEALRALWEGGGAHQSLVSLAGRFAAAGVSEAMAVDLLRSAILQRPDAGRDQGWRELLDDCARTVHWAYEKEAQSATQYAAVLASAPPASGAGGHAGGNGGTPPPGPSGGATATPGTSPQPQGSTQSPPLPPAPPLMRNRSPKFAGNVENVLTILRHDARLAGCFAYDEMALISVIQHPPWQPTLLARQVRDDDVTCLQAWLQREIGLSRVGQDPVWHGIGVATRENSFHPVRDYLNGLQWDGAPRLDTWLQRYAGAADNDYTKAVGKMFLVGMAARVARPGCKMDYVLILEGPQGRLKSQLLAELARPWFSDNLPDIRHGSKELSLALRGQWLLELAELAAVQKSDVTALNAFITRPVEHYRPPYSRDPVVEPRQCVLAATTNRSVYLHDPTGGRRFWPVTTDHPQPLLLRQERDQLWAEAWRAYRDGTRWWPQADFEAAAINPEQLTRYAGDGWEEPVRNYLQTVLQNTQKTTLLDVAIHALALTDLTRLTPPVQRRIAAILQELGWVSRRNNTARWWEKKQP